MSYASEHSVTPDAPTRTVRNPHGSAKIVGPDGRVKDAKWESLREEYDNQDAVVDGTIPQDRPYRIC